MPRYRKLPVVIDAFQWTGANPFELGDWRGQWPREFPDFHVCDNGELEVRTLEDGHDFRVQHVASPGDWIIRGVKGEFYPCKPDIFADTYEPEDAAEVAALSTRLAVAGEELAGMRERYREACEALARKHNNPDCACVFCEDLRAARRSPTTRGET